MMAITGATGDVLLRFVQICLSTLVAVVTTATAITIVLSFFNIITIAIATITTTIYSLNAPTTPPACLHQWDVFQPAPSPQCKQAYGEKRKRTPFVLNA